jgi:hypothetical protein
MVKRCKDCLEEKDIKYFRRAGKYYQSYCNKCNDIRHRKWVKENPVNTKFTQAKSKLGISREQFDRIVNNGGVCDICGMREEDYKQFLGIDHCHKTGEFRGQLCQECNHGIGKFKEDIRLLGNAIGYLKRYMPYLEYTGISG